MRRVAVVLVLALGACQLAACQGQTGPAGPPGPPGPRGEKGEAGPAGANGVTVSVARNVCERSKAPPGCRYACKPGETILSTFYVGAGIAPTVIREGEDLVAFATPGSTSVLYCIPQRALRP